MFGGFLGSTNQSALSQSADHNPDSCSFCNFFSSWYRTFSAVTLCCGYMATEMELFIRRLLVFFLALSILILPIISAHDISQDIVPPLSAPSSPKSSIQGNSEPFDETTPSSLLVPSFEPPSQTSLVLSTPSDSSPSISSIPLGLDAPIAPSGAQNPVSSTPFPPEFDEPHVPIAVPVSLPPWLQIPQAGVSCIGEAPDIAFWCLEGVWTYRGNVSVGVGQRFEKLVISGPTYIEGWLNIVTYKSLVLAIPRLDDTRWNHKSISLLTVSECMVSSSQAPLVEIPINTTYTFPLSSTTTYTVWGIDTRCNSDSLSVSWNTFFGDAQPVVSESFYYSFIDQYRTFPSTNDPDRFVSRIRLQWKYSGPTRPYAAPRHKGLRSEQIMGISIGCVILGIILICTAIPLCGGCKGGGSGGDGGGGGSDFSSSWDNSSSNNNDYGTFDSGGGGGGGGGSDWVSSSAGSWD